MDEPLVVAIFCEDSAHERLIEALVKRLALEEGCPTSIRTVSGHGGHGKAISELRAYQKTGMNADLIIAAIDSNCSRWSKARQEIERAIDATRFSAWAVACPDPHIERWYLADPQGLKSRLGTRYQLTKRKCGRDLYKNHLYSALSEAGHTVNFGGAEFADEIGDAMDFFRAGKNEPSLKHFLDDLSRALKQAP